jgi:hypothetical protein
VMFTGGSFLGRSVPLSVPWAIAKVWQEQWYAKLTVAGQNVTFA